MNTSSRCPCCNMATAGCRACRSSLSEPMPSASPDSFRTPAPPPHSPSFLSSMPRAAILSLPPSPKSSSAPLYPMPCSASLLSPESFPSWYFPYFHRNARPWNRIPDAFSFSVVGFRISILESIELFFFAFRPPLNELRHELCRINLL